MRCEVHGVDVHVGADRVRCLDDRRQIRCRSEQVRRTRHGDPLGSLVDQIDHVVRRQLPGRRIERRQHLLGTSSVSRPTPRSDVGIVVEPRADDPIAGTKGFADCSRDRERQRGHVGPEDDAVRIGAEELADRIARAIHQSLALLRCRERAAVCRGVATGHPVAHRRDGRVDHLRAGGPVEPRPLRPDAGKPVAQRPAHFNRVFPARRRPHESFRPARAGA